MRRTVESKFSPKELSRKALETIYRSPVTWRQMAWHTGQQKEGFKPKTVNGVEEPMELVGCGTAHCYAGHIDLFLLQEYNQSHSAGEELSLTEDLVFDVQEVLGLDTNQWRAITNLFNPFERLVQYHNQFFGDDLSFPSPPYLK